MALSEPIELYLLRHADAGDPEAWSGDDAARPLSAKGRRQAERLGRHLDGLGFRPDAVVTSPKVRAVETAELAMATLEGVPPIAVDDRIAGGFGVAELDDLLGSLRGARRVVLVGHDPDFSELLNVLAGADNLTMKKGAIARLDLTGGVVPGGAAPGGTVPGGASLRWLIPPDAIVGRARH